MSTERPLVPSRFIRGTPQQSGGGRSRERLVAHARASIVKGSRSFAAASMLFARPTRERAWLLYAWCRRCDDLADDQHLGGTPTGPGIAEKGDAEDRLQAIRILTHRALEGQPTADPAFDALGQVAGEMRLTQDMVDDVIAGFAMDSQEFRPRSKRDLLRYCYHVAGAVGVMMAQVMDAPDDVSVFDRACDLGIAFQLANIARDIVEDDAAGRCYIPTEWLAEADLEPGQHAKPHNRFALAAIAARLIDLMEIYEDAARVGAARLSFRDRWAVLAAARIYGAIGRRVRDLGQIAWDRRVRIGPVAKLGHVSAAFVEAVRNRPPELETWPEYSRAELRPMKGW